MDYVVEVKDLFKNLVIFSESYDDANTAYHVKRELEDQYQDYDKDALTIVMIEPSDV